MLIFGGTCDPDPIKCAKSASSSASVFSIASAATAQCGDKGYQYKCSTCNDAAGGGFTYECNEAKCLGLDYCIFVPDTDPPPPYTAGEVGTCIPDLQCGKGSSIPSVSSISSTPLSSSVSSVPSVSSVSSVASIPAPYLLFPPKSSLSSASSSISSVSSLVLTLIVEQQSSSGLPPPPPPAPPPSAGEGSSPSPPQGGRGQGMGASSGEVGSCGNALLERPSEECDDGNLRDLDGCTSDCRLEQGVCGDGLVQTLLGEQCEQSLFDPALPYQCIRCRFVSQFCGDGKLDPGEECDLGARNSDTPTGVTLPAGRSLGGGWSVVEGCRSDCSLPRCGDGVIDAGEECDPPSSFGAAQDYGRAGGCDRSCRQEAPAAPASVLSAISPYAFLPPAPWSGQRTADSVQQAVVSGQLPGQQFLQPRLPQQTAETGPELLAIMAAGAAGGWAFMRRRGWRRS